MSTSSSAQVLRELQPRVPLPLPALTCGRLGRPVLAEGSRPQAPLPVAEASTEHLASWDLPVSAVASSSH